MGYVLDIYYGDGTLVVTFFKLFSIGIIGISKNDYSTSSLCFSLWKAEISTTIGWRKNA